MIICVLLFMIFFQFSMGTVNWIYIAETMHEKALGVAVSIVWFMSLAISISIPLLVQTVDVGYIFLTLGVCTVVGTIFIGVFLIETKDRTNREIDE